MHDIQLLAKQLKILSDKNRLKLLNHIKQGEACGCDLIHCLDISQPTLSHHLNLLSDVGLITSRKVKTKVHYTINQPMIDDLFKRLETLLNTPILC